MAATAVELTEHTRSELKAAFHAFGEGAEQLSAAFEALGRQVAQLREELRDAHAGRAHLAHRLAALIEALPGGVLVLDERGIIQECNPAAVALLGEPLAALTYGAVLARNLAAGAALGEPSELRSGRFVNISRRALTGGGEVVLLTDVTESHLMQRLILRQQRLLTLGELAAGLAHQIRTPLAAALLYASRMSMPEQTPETLARCGVRTAESLKQLDTLVNSMLAFARGGASRERVSVSALLEQVAEWLRPALRPGARLTIRTEAPSLAVRANAASLVSAVLNLATNALQASAGPLELQLLARRAPEERAQIVVSDDGPGIPRPIRERIFEPFFTTRKHGNGIGLAIVKSVVEAHGGTVHLAESALGATFIIELKAESEA
jgi:two-component system sensor histidine kinase FlrB